MADEQVDRWWEKLPPFALLNEHQCSVILGLSVQTLRNRRVRGGGPRYRKLGGAVRYKLSDVLGFIEAAPVKGGPDLTPQPIPVKRPWRRSQIKRLA